jgi:hypothetical protein
MHGGGKGAPACRRRSGYDCAAFFSLAPSGLRGGKTSKRRMGIIHAPSSSIGAEKVHRAPCLLASSSSPFEADFSYVLPQLLVVIPSCIALALLWWRVVVPQERVTLSKNKRRGKIKEYLDDIEAVNGRTLPKWFFTDWLEQRKRKGSVPDGKAEPFFLSTDNPVVVAGILIGSGVLYSILTGR